MGQLGPDLWGRQDIYHLIVEFGVMEKVDVAIDVVLVIVVMLVIVMMLVIGMMMVRRSSW